MYFYIHKTNLTMAMNVSKHLTFHGSLQLISSQPTIEMVSQLNTMNCLTYIYLYNLQQQNIPLIPEIKKCLSSA